MTAIRISVSTQMDGVTYSIAPGFKELLRKLFPKARPANTLFVSYDTSSDFEKSMGKMEPHIVPALLGVSDAEAHAKIDVIEFVDPVTDKVLRKVQP